MKALPVQFATLDISILGRAWPAVLSNLRRADFGYLATVLENAEPVRFTGGRLVLWFPALTTAYLLEHRRDEFEPPLAQAIWVVCGMHCGIEPVSGAGVIAV